MPKRIVVALVFVGLIVFAGASFFVREKARGIKKETIVTFKNIAVKAETADTSALRTRGLSGHAPLGEKEGMWFDFKTSGYPGIWMKEMVFPLDILWFDEEFRLVYIKEGADPRSYPEVFTPSSSARYVLEVPAGFVRRYGVSLLDRITVHNTP